ncbi:MAG: hypothetical protein ACFNLE_07050, partial [Rothia aeria]
VAWVMVTIHKALVLIGFPDGPGIAWVLSIIGLTIVVALIVEVYHEKVQMGLSISPDRYPEKGQPFKSYESYESEDEAEKSIEDEADTSAQQVKQGKKTSEPAKQE